MAVEASRHTVEPALHDRTFSGTGALKSFPFHFLDNVNSFFAHM
jgi:hypothetical protein